MKTHTEFLIDECLKRDHPRCALIDLVSSLLLVAEVSREYTQGEAYPSDVRLALQEASKYLEPAPFVDPWFDPLYVDRLAMATRAVS